jgi:tetratricopeptide (TPR) repeat protein
MLLIIDFVLWTMLLCLIIRDAERYADGAVRQLAASTDHEQNKRPRLADTVRLKNRAFLSYSHQDARWARWLHARLEGFRIDKDLMGSKGRFGPVPKDLRPIFRDREDFPSGQKLSEATVEELDASEALIVLCSTVSASRPAVNDEVQCFRSRHPDRLVIPVIIDGAVPDNFPPALRYELTEKGIITDRPANFLGPDLRDSADGRNLGLAKLVAGLLGLSPDEIVRRAERARRQRNRVWAGLAAVFLFLALAAAGGAIYAWQQLKTNEAFLDAALKTATEIVNTAVAQAEKYNVPRIATLELLLKAEALFGDMARFGRPTPELSRRKAWMLIEFARNYWVLGDTGKQFAHATEAYRLLAGLAAEKPGDATYQYDLSIAHSEVGNVLVERGDLAGALNHYRDGLAIVETLAKSDRDNTDWQNDLTTLYERVGNALVKQRNLPDALTFYDKGLPIIERLAKSDPGNARWQRELGGYYVRVRELLVMQGKFAEALKSSRDGLEIIERLAKSEPRNAGIQRDLAATYLTIGDVLAKQGEFLEAFKSFHDGLEIIERLAKSDPSNADLQVGLAAAYAQFGIASMRAKDNKAALDTLRKGREIMERLTKLSPDNADWKRHLDNFNGFIAMLTASRAIRINPAPAQ